MPIVVLEGADGVGKTTLADAIEGTWPGCVHRISCGPPPKDTAVYDHYALMLEEAAFRHDALTVFDRFHVGELVYGHIMRGGSRLTHDEAYDIDYRLESLGASMIHCTLDRDEMLRRLMARDGGRPDAKSGAAPRHSEAIAAAFRWACRGFLPGPWMTIDMNAYPSHNATRVLEPHLLALNGSRR